MPTLTNQIVWDSKYQSCQCGTALMKKWLSRCGRYCVAEITSPYAPNTAPKFGAVYRRENHDGSWNESYIDLEREEDGKSKGYYPHYYDSLEAVLKSVERYHTTKFGLCTSNREKFLQELGLLPLTADVQSAMKKERQQSEEEKVVQVLRGGSQLTADQIEKKTSITNVKLLLLRMAARKVIGRSGKFYLLKGEK